jgi:hypothetical protein
VASADARIREVFVAESALSLFLTMHTKKMSLKVFFHIKSFGIWWKQKVQLFAHVVLDYSAERVEYSVHAVPRVITRNMRGSALQMGELR